MPVHVLLLLLGRGIKAGVLDSERAGCIRTMHVCVKAVGAFFKLCGPNRSQQIVWGFLCIQMGTAATKTLIVLKFSPK